MDRHFWHRAATCGLAAMILTMCGCRFFPESMQPQNLQKLNRGPAPSHDPFFSVPDSMTHNSSNGLADRLQQIGPPATDPFYETEEESKDY